MVDVERLRSRLGRLDVLVGLLDEVHAGGEAAYLSDSDVRLKTERALQLAEQICIDVGAQLVSELAAEPPSDYAGIFTSLARGGHLEAGLAERLQWAARQRNLLVHDYLEIDDRQVFAALGRLGDLREFAAVAERLAAEG